MLHAFLPLANAAARYRTPLLVLGAGLALTLICKDQFDERHELEQAVQKVLEAAGGESKLALVRGLTARTEVVMHDPWGTHIALRDTAMEWPDRHRFVFTSAENERIQQFQLLNGTEGWFRDPRGLRPMRSEQLKEALETTYLARFSFLPIALRDPDLELTLVGETTVEDQTAFGIQVVHPRFRELVLYFDRETGLLVRRDSYPVERTGSGRVYSMQTFYSDHRTVDGITVPFQARFLQGNARMAETDIRELRFHTEPLPDRLFTPP
jgi:hypothetical protein